MNSASTNNKQNWTRAHRLVTRTGSGAQPHKPPAPPQPPAPPRAHSTPSKGPAHTPRNPEGRQAGAWGQEFNLCFISTLSPAPTILCCDGRNICLEQRVGPCAWKHAGFGTENQRSLWISAQQAMTLWCGKSDWASLSLSVLICKMGIINLPCWAVLRSKQVNNKRALGTF